MRKFLAAVALSFLAVFLSAQFPTVEHPFLADKNLLKNPGFEFNLSSWTASGAGAGTFVADTSTPMNGSASATWNPSGTNGFLRPASVVVPQSYRGRACVVGFTYSWDTGTAGHITAKVDDGTNDLFTAVNLNVTSSSAPGRFEAGFVCPNSATPIRLTLSSTADAAAIEIDDVWLGNDYRRGVLGDQAELIAQSSIGQNACQWTDTDPPAFSGSEGDPFDSEVSTCVLTNSSLNSVTVTKVTGQPAIVVQSLPPGKYRLTVNATGRLLNAPGGGDELVLCLRNATDTGILSRGACAFHTIAETGAQNTFVMQGTFTNTTTRNMQFNVTHSVTDNTNTDVSVDANPSSGQEVQFILERFPSQSPRDTVTLETAGSSYQAKHQNDCAFQRANTSFGAFNVDATCTFSDITNNSFGTVTSQLSGPDKLPGIVFTPRYAGSYYICARANPNNTVTGVVSLRLTDGTIVYDESASLGTPTADTFDTVHLCAIANFNAATARTFSLEGKATANTAEVKSPSGNSSTITWTVFPITQQFPQAVALTELDPTKVTSGVAATKMGLKAYSCTAPTVTANAATCVTNLVIAQGALSAVTRAVFIPYQMFDGTWRLRFNLRLTSGSSANPYQFTLSNTVFKNVGSYGQSCSAAQQSGVTGGIIACTADPNTGQITIRATASDSAYSVSGDVELESKPGWAD